jgi:hypothetical protein
MCLDHDDCKWYRHNPDNAGSDLGYGDGWRNGRDFALKHGPMATHLLPVSDGRSDDFAIGFLDGVVAQWCERHETTSTNRCLAHNPCRVAVQAQADALARI